MGNPFCSQNFDPSQNNSQWLSPACGALVLLNPLPDDKILDWSKLKQIVDDMRLGKKPFENIVGKGEIACTSNFSFTYNVF